MTGQLITLPVRLWWRGAKLLVHTAEEATELALSTTLRLAGALENLRPGAHPSPPEPSFPAASAPAPSAPVRPAPAERGRNGGPEPLASERLRREGFPAAVDLTPARPEPSHVSEEPELVRESAEPGAEEGAGASLHVRAPWEGYERMSAREVIARCSGASSAELAAVQLYESGHRNRRTVLQAVEREMKSPHPGR